MNSAMKLSFITQRRQHNSEYSQGVTAKPKDDIWTSFKQNLEENQKKSVVLFKIEYIKIVLNEHLSLFQVEDLEKQLHLAQSEVAEAQTEQDQCSQESGNLNNQIHQLLVKTSDNIEKNFAF